MILYLVVSMVSGWLNDGQKMVHRSTKEDSVCKMLDEIK